MTVEKKFNLNKIWIYLYLSIGLIMMLGLISCKSTPKNLQADQSVSSDELKNVAKQFANEIASYFKSNPDDKGVFVALLSTKNDTTQNLPVDVIDFSLVNQLLKKKIYTIRTEDRGKALEEIEFTLTGLADSDLTIGQMKSPNYFIKMKIKENYVRQGGDRYIEYTVFMEMRSVAKQLVVATDSYDFIKRLPKAGSEIGW